MLSTVSKTILIYCTVVMNCSKIMFQAAENHIFNINFDPGFISNQTGDNDHNIFLV